MRSILIVLFIALTALPMVGCDDSAELEATESDAIARSFTTGISQSDPFVRAETFRVIELLADPTFTTYATKGIDDKSAMVRIASLRATLAVDRSEGGRAAAKIFSRANAQERLVILDTIADFGIGPSQRELLARALRSDDDQLRRSAFEYLYLDRVDEAVRTKNDNMLKSTLLPEIGRYIGVDKDPVIAALALGKLLELGYDDRADVLISTLNDEKAPLEKRLKAARILVGARAKPAVPHFNALIERYDATLADESLGVPTEIVPPPLLRQAILGSVAAGDTQYVDRARAYYNAVTEEQALEVLEALGSNPSADAALTIKIAMQDARRPVRLRAIEIYQERPDADAKALLKALEGAEYETQKRLTLVLRERFPEEWIKDLSSRVQQISKMEPTLELMRDVITTREEAKDLVAPMKDVFARLVEREEGGRAALASYFLAIAADGQEGSKIAAEKLDETTLYAYLEFLVRTNPDAHVETFRRYLYDDLFVIRLMAAAGLWEVLGKSDAAGAGSAEPAENPDE